MARARLFRVSRLISINLKSTSISFKVWMCVRLWYVLCSVHGELDGFLVIVDTVIDGIRLAEGASQ